MISPSWPIHLPPTVPSLNRDTVSTWAEQEGRLGQPCRAGNRLMSVAYLYPALLPRRHRCLAAGQPFRESDALLQRLSYVRPLAPRGHEVVSAERGRVQSGAQRGRWYRRGWEPLVGQPHPRNEVSLAGVGFEPPPQSSLREPRVGHSGKRFTPGGGKAGHMCQREWTSQCPVQGSIGKVPHRGQASAGRLTPGSPRP